MPHKHRLKCTDASSHELPPTSIAHPLPVSKPRQQQKAPQKRKIDPKDNDTPRAFTRLMNYTSTRHKPPRGLDDGTTPSATNKKRKRNSHDEDQAGSPTVPNNVHPSSNSSSNPTLPKILPGERMADFSARVNHALPVVGLDPWAVVAANRKREQEAKEKGEGKGGLVGLHDVVLAPPKFTKAPTKKVHVADVVRKGGLKRQVELSEARISVMEGYRRMMRERREEGASIDTA
ncbi:MAG: hypothetical protein LQ339_000074 [Xanthoria mediterranea]|nr:MAG: hypothetical protein LQ339_000074 [Xanthoria mediterranea]